VLGEEEAADLGDLLRRDHGRPPGRPSGGPPGAPGPPPGDLLGPPGELPGPAAHSTARGAGLGKGLRSSRGIATSSPAVGTTRDGRCQQARQEDATRRGRLGRVMRHAPLAAGPVGALPVPVIQPPFGALLVAAPRGAETPGPALAATGRATVGMAPITGTADEERPPTEPAGPHSEDLQGPAGPEMSGRRWTNEQECGISEQVGPRPRGVGRPEGLELPPPGPHPFTSGVGVAYPTCRSIAKIIPGECSNSYAFR